MSTTPCLVIKLQMVGFNKLTDEILTKNLAIVTLIKKLHSFMPLSITSGESDSCKHEWISSKIKHFQ
jgi:hypothetical protein